MMVRMKTCQILRWSIKRYEMEREREREYVCVYYLPIPAAVAKRRKETTREPKDSNSEKRKFLIKFSLVD